MTACASTGVAAAADRMTEAARSLYLVIDVLHVADRSRICADPLSDRHSKPGIPAQANSCEIAGSRFSDRKSAGTVRRSFFAPKTPVIRNAGACSRPTAEGHCRGVGLA